MLRTYHTSDLDQATAERLSRLMNLTANNTVVMQRNYNLDKFEVHLIIVESRIQRCVYCNEVFAVLQDA